MNRSVIWRGLAMLTSSTGLLVGCGAETPSEGDLPKTKVATPEELQNLQKKIEQEKVSKSDAYKPPPGIVLPKK